MHKLINRRNSKGSAASHQKTEEPWNQRRLRRSEGRCRDAAQPVNRAKHEAISEKQDLVPRTQQILSHERERYWWSLHWCRRMPKMQRGQNGFRLPSTSPEKRRMLQRVQFLHREVHRVWSVHERHSRNGGFFVRTCIVFRVLANAAQMQFLQQAILQLACLSEAYTFWEWRVHLWFLSLKIFDRKCRSPDHESLRSIGFCYTNEWISTFSTTTSSYVTQGNSHP